MEFFASWVFKCRMWVYLKMKYPKLEVVSKAVKNGFEAERKVESFLKTIGVEYKKQPRGRILLADFSISGRADFLTKNCVIEVKSSKTNFRREWLAQLNLYMKMFDVETGILVRLSGNSVIMKAYEFNNELYRESLKYFEWFLENKPSPPEKCEEKWCGFRHVCMGKR